jgi:hypothetical protein
MLDLEDPAVATSPTFGCGLFAVGAAEETAALEETEAETTGEETGAAGKDSTTEVVVGAASVVVGLTVCIDAIGSETAAVVVAVGVMSLARASKYPGHVGLLNMLITQGSTEYFRLKLTLITSGPYGPAQPLLSLPIKPY